MLGTREIGELCVRGGNVMLGYWNQPEETAKVMRNGWLLTGDIGYRDARGLLLHHRPEEGHAAGQRHQRLSARDRGDSLPVPGREGGGGHWQARFPQGRAADAFVAANEGAVLDEKALQQFVRRKLADYKVPRKVVLLPALPRNATGKILKTALREICQSAS